jgi:hypothetical protein
VLAGCAAALLAGLAWLLVTGALARQELGRIRAGVPRLRAALAAGDMATVQAQAAALGTAAHRAHLLTTGPVWSAAAAVPLLGGPLRTARGLAATADDLGRGALPELAAAAALADPGVLRTAGDRIDVDALAAAVPALEAAAGDLAGAQARVTALPGRTWLAPADTARAAVLGQLTELRPALRGAADTARILAALLGRGGPQRVFVAVQNEAEARGTGGLPGAFAILLADRGRVRLDRVASDSVLAGVSSGLDLGADYRDRYADADPTGYFGNSNISPHFPFAARIWAAMWQRRTGQRIDAAVAVDPTALSYLLAVTGPTRMADGTRIDAGSVVALTEQGSYARFRDETRRKAYLRDLARVVVSRLLGRHGDPAALARALARAAGERRLLVWSADPAVQALLARTAAGGVLPTGPGPFTGLVVVNAGGNKLDYYLDRWLSYRRSGCGGTTTATIVLANNAPGTGLPPLVTGRSDQPDHPTRPGDTVLLASYYATAGAGLAAATLDGAPTTLAAQQERGHPVFTAAVEIPAGQRRTLVITLIEPPAPGPVTVLRQPLVRPLRVSVTGTGC